MPKITSPKHEFLSAAVMSFGMNNIGVELAIVKPFLEETWGFKGVDSQQLFLTILFLHLCFFFGPFYNGKSRGAVNNPVVYFLFYMIGDCDFTELLNGATAAIFGTIAGTFVYSETLKLYPLTGFNGIAPAVAAGGAVGGTLSEAVVAFSNFAFAGVSPQLVGKEMAPYAGAFFYIITVVLERCRYSCGFMNPAVVLATHIVGGDFMTQKALTHVATYACGAMLGAAAAAGVKFLADGGSKKKTKRTVAGKKSTKKAPTSTRSSARVRSKRKKA